MIDYKTVDSNTLNRILSSLDLKNPVVDIERNTGYSRGTVSQYLSGAKKTKFCVCEKIRGNQRLKMSYRRGYFKKNGGLC